MNEVDEKVFELIEILKNLEIIKSESEFYRSIGILRQNANKVKNKEKHFTIKHCHNICRVYNVNLNWLFGMEKARFRTN